MVDEVAQRLGIDKKCTTDQIKINGFPEQGLATELAKKMSSDEDLIGYLIHNYGQQSVDLTGLDQDLILAEAKFAIQNEMCLNCYDFFVRRTGRMYFDIDSVRTSKDKVGKLFATHYNWSEDQLKKELNRVDEEITKRSVFK